MDSNIDLNNQTPAPSPDVAELNTRRALIKSLYQEVLGRDADINGLSYYTVHKEISEDEIRKQMCQSTDHRDLIVKSQNYPELEKKCISLEDHFLKLQNDSAQKDILISNLRAVASSPQPQYNYATNNSYADDLIQSSQPNMNINPQDINSIVNVTNLKYPKNKGIIGTIKSFFGK